MALTDTAIRNAKPRAKPYKMADSQGLYLLVNPKGSKLWRVKYRIEGVERKLALGPYPDVTLAEARTARDAARKQLVQSIDPNAAKRQARIEASIRASHSFVSVAEELIEKKTREGLAEPTLEKIQWFVKLLGPDFGKRPVTEITPQELLHELRKHERRGRLETANLLRSFASRVFRYAVATARAERDPAHLLIGALTSAKVRHFAAITDPAEFGALLRAIDDYQGNPSVMFALKLTPHVFQRPGELRQMEWAEVDFEKAVWTIPISKMEMRQPNAVPLSFQARTILEEMRSLSGSGRYVFPSIRTLARPISDNTINAALRRMGYSKEQMTAHGFRTSASSLLNESGKWNPDAIERALAHMVAGGPLVTRLLELPDPVVMEVLGIVMAETLASGSDLIETLGPVLKVEMADCWTVDAAFYEALRDREVGLAILAEVGGSAVATANAAEKDKTIKGLIADFLTGENGRPKTERWVPRWMRFPPTAYTGRGGSPKAKPKKPSGRQANLPRSGRMPRPMPRTNASRRERFGAAGNRRPIPAA